MESVQNLKKRIKSVANINKITKAMELVAATKMRKAQEVALASRPYAFSVLNLLSSLSLLEKGNKSQFPKLLVQRKVKKVLFVLVSSDKGLAGAFNSSVFKKFEVHMKRDEKKYKDEEKLYVAVGEKSAMYLQKKKLPVLKKFIQAGDHVETEQVGPLADFIIEGYLRGGKKWPASNASAVADAGWDRVVVISTHFRSALKQEAHVRRILPVDYDHVKDTIKELVPETGKFSDLSKEIELGNKKETVEYLIEPSPELVLDNLSKHLLFVQIYNLILEANASEHSARRMAMKTASDNASDLGEKLNLQYNKSRQAAITKEIIEIVAGAEALN